MKFKAALWAFDHNVPLALRNTDLLAAPGALIDVVAFVALPFLFQMGQVPARVAEEIRDAADDLHIFLILRVAPRNIAGEHTEVQIDNEEQYEPPEEAGAEEEVQQDQDDRETGQKLIEMVHAVSAAHELSPLVTKTIEHEIPALRKLQHTDSDDILMAGLPIARKRRQKEYEKSIKSAMQIREEAKVCNDHRSLPEWLREAPVTCCCLII